MAARRVGQLSFVSTRPQGGQGGQDPLDLFRRPTVGQLAAGLTPSILPWQSSNELCHFAADPPQRRAYGSAQLGPRARKLAEFGIKSATNRLSTQVPIVTDFTNGANERIWPGGRW